MRLPTLEIDSLLGSASAEKFSISSSKQAFLLLVMFIGWLAHCLVRSYLLFFAIILFLLIVLFYRNSVNYLLGVSFIYYVYYYSYPTVLYSCHNTCNNYSYCDHTIRSAHSIHVRMRLHWVSLTCAQVGLKCSPNKANPNFLTSD